MKKIFPLFAIFGLVFLSILNIPTQADDTDNLGGCTYLVSCPNGQSPYIVRAQLVCMNGFVHDPMHLWDRGYWNQEITCCNGDYVIVTLADYNHTATNHCVKYHGVAPNMSDQYGYGNTGDGSRKTKFQLVTSCTQTNASANFNTVEEDWGPPPIDPLPWPPFDQ